MYIFRTHPSSFITIIQVYYFISMLVFLIFIVASANFDQVKFFSCWYFQCLYMIANAREHTVHSFSHIELITLQNISSYLVSYALYLTLFKFVSNEHHMSLLLSISVPVRDPGEPLGSILGPYYQHFLSYNNCLLIFSPLHRRHILRHGLQIFLPTAHLSFKQY